MDKEQQTTEVRDTNTQVGDTNVSRQTVEKTSQTSGLVIFQRVVWFVAGVIIALLLLRIVLLLLAANEGSPFVDFIYALSSVFAAPFYGIFNYTPSYGQFYFEISSVVAAVIYSLVAWGITKLATLTRPSEEI